MAIQKASSNTGEGPQSDAAHKDEECLQPALIDLVRLLARAAALEAFEASQATKDKDADAQ